VCGNGPLNHISCLCFAQLSREVDNSHDESNGFSEEVVKEYDIFSQAKADEMKEYLLAYTDSHVEFFKEVNSYSVAPCLWSCVYIVFLLTHTNYEFDIGKGNVGIAHSHLRVNSCSCKLTNLIGSRIIYLRLSWQSR